MPREVMTNFANANEVMPPREPETELIDELVDDARARWLEERRKSIGSSEAGAIIGESPHSSPLSVWADKTGSPVTMPPEVEERLRWGQLLEPIILAEYAARRGGIETSRFPQNQLIRHPDASIPMHATPDAEDDEGRIVEAKNYSAFVAAEVKKLGAPLVAQIQVQHQMACMEREKGTIVILLGGCELWWADVERNDRFIRLLERACADFWQLYVVPGKMPPPDGHKATVRALQALHPDDSGATVELPPEAVEWDHRLAEIKKVLKELEAEKADLENRFKTAIGAATFGTLPGTEGSYKWATQTRKAHAVKESKFRVLRRLKG